MNPAIELGSAHAIDLVDDVATLEMLADEGLLTENLEKHLQRCRHRARLVAELDDVLDRFRSDKRRKEERVQFLRGEPTAGLDELGLFVLTDELSNVLATADTVLGRTGQGAESTSWTWLPRPAPALQFIDRAEWRKLRKVAGVAVVVLDPPRRNSDFADLFALIASSPARVQRVHETWSVVVRGTSSLTLLEQWAAHRDVEGDRQRRRIVAEQIARVKVQAEAAE